MSGENCRRTEQIKINGVRSKYFLFKTEIKLSVADMLMVMFSL